MPFRYTLARSHIILVSVVFALLLFQSYIAAQKDIHVGALFGKFDVALREVFEITIDKYNSNPTRRFHVTSTIALINMTNGYELQARLCDFVKRGVYVIFGSNYQSIANDIQAFSRAYRIPYITPGFVKEVKPTERDQQDFILNSRPRYTGALVSMLLYYDLRNFSYICNSAEGLLRLQDSLKHLHAEELEYVDLNIDVRYLGNVRRAHNNLRLVDEKLAKYKIKNIVIDIDPPEDVNILVRQLKDMGMNREEYHYIITGIAINETVLDGFYYSGVNVTGFQLLTQDVRKRLGQHWPPHLMAQKGFRLYELALMADAVDVFLKTLEQPSYSGSSLANEWRPSHRIACNKFSGDWGTTTVYSARKSNPTPTALFANLTSQSFVGHTGRVAFDRNGYRKLYTLNVVELISYKQLQLVGTWNDSSGLDMKIPTIEYRRKRIRFADVQNQTFRVVMIENKPFMQLKEPKPGEVLEGNAKFEGFCVELLQKVAEIAKFNYEIHIVWDDKFGTKIGEHNGYQIWNGLIGEILNGTADISVAPLTINSDRAGVVDFSEPFISFGISVMIKKPDKQKPGTFSFLLPLSHSVWACILAAMMCVAIGLYIIARVSPLEWTLVHDEDLVKVERDFSLFNAVWFSLSAFVQQGVDISPRSPGARLLSSVWWFFTMIMIAYYTANLAAFLTVEKLVTPIDDWNDLIRDDVDIKYGTLLSGSTERFFYTTRLPPFSEMGTVMKRNKDYLTKTTEEGVERVRKSGGKYAFLMESPMNDYYNNRNPCNTMMIGQPFGDKGYGIATPQNSPLTDKINHAVLKLRERQVLAELYKTWWVDKGQCTDDGQKAKRGDLALINVAGVFYILVGGLGLSLVTSFFEFYYTSRMYTSRVKAAFYKSASHDECHHPTAATSDDRSHCGLIKDSISGSAYPSNERLRIAHPSTNSVSLI